MRAKRLIAVLWALFFAFLPARGAADSGVVISAVVPATHTLTVNCGEHGWILVDGAYHGGTVSISVPRLGDVSFTAIPEEGWEVSDILVDSGDGVSLFGTTVVLEGVYMDRIASVTFARLQPAGEADPPLAETQKDGALETRLSLPSIVRDGRGESKDYLFAQIPGDAQSGAEALIIAKTPAEGEDQTRVLSLSGVWLRELSARNGVRALTFVDGGVAAALDVGEALTGDVAKLVELLLSGRLITDGGALALILSETPDVELTWSQLAQMRLDVRVEPVPVGERRTGVRVSVWLYCGGVGIDVSALITSLRVCIKAEGMLEEADSAAFAARCAIALLPDVDEGEEAAEPLPLDTALRLMPGIAANQSDFLALYEGRSSLEESRGYALCANYAGSGIYTVVRRPEE